jgi:hypothetical protein
MHSQPAAVFKRKRSTVAFIGILMLYMLVVGFTCLFWRSSAMTVLGVAMIVLDLGLSYRLWLFGAKPYLHLTDHQITLYRGILPSPRQYSLKDIRSAHTNQPETYIELLGENPGNPLRIDLHPLDKADRIRFIFLVESNINRKFSHKHTPAA